MWPISIINSSHVRDALCLHYGTIHVINNCPLSGFHSTKNELRDITASLLTEVVKMVIIMLQPLSSEYLICNSHLSQVLIKACLTVSNFNHILCHLGFQPICCILLKLLINATDNKKGMSWGMKNKLSLVALCHLSCWLLVVWDLLNVSVVF